MSVLAIFYTFLQILPLFPVFLLLGRVSPCIAACISATGIQPYQQHRNSATAAVPLSSQRLDNGPATVSPDPHIFRESATHSQRTRANRLIGPLGFTAGCLYCCCLPEDCGCGIIIQSDDSGES